MIDSWITDSEWAVKRHEGRESWWRKEDWNKPLGRWQLWVPLNCLTHYCSSTAVHGDGALREGKALGWAPTAGEWKKGVFLKPPEGRYKEPLRCFGLLTTSCIRAGQKKHLEWHECGSGIYIRDNIYAWGLWSDSSVWAIQETNFCSCTSSSCYNTGIL